MSENERLKQIQKFLGFRTQTEFAKALGMQQGSIGDVLRGKDGVGVSDSIKRILEKEYSINIDWLESGEGEITKIKNLDKEELPYIFLLPISAQAGSLNDFIVSIKDSDCERIISPIKGADFAMQVSGDSMAPEYPAGSQILIKKINEKAFIDWGKVYVLDTVNGSVLKKIFPSDDNDSCKIKCVSINPDYPSYEISLKDDVLFGIYRVLLCMSMK